ncbi:hypothetical protein WG66_005685 [Moniliophthora roreri]|uniref:Uncharacterized protein n=1 Tax=Moniliophthora roreri TaxID=221103 RepID=A0A0W0FTN4_MONRR|nr:hypothetical protein WG66_005685 [Moniliophthora roreri]
MDPNAVNTNVTIDDFDSLITYADQSQWTTPDTFSADYNPDSKEWLRGTYHLTEVVGAELDLNFTGPAIYIYGHSGPSYGSYSIDIDGISTTKSAYAAQNVSTPYLLYEASNLAYAKHTLRLKNLGKQDQDQSGNGLLLDFIRSTVQLAPEGATVENKTIEETDPSITYTGEWGHNQSGNFSGGGSTYTNGDGASFSLTFQASAIYVFGDKKNDHGLYSVSLDNGSAEIYNGVSGCGGGFGFTCEQQLPSIKYFASNLAQGNHTLTLTNIPGVNKSFFDLDSIVLTVPSKYGPRQLNASTLTTRAAQASPTTPNGNGSHPGTSAMNPILFMILAVVWVFNGIRL